MSIATRVSTAILNGFESAIEIHNQKTLEAKYRFEGAHWAQVTDAQKLRSYAYREGIKRAQSKIQRLAGGQLLQQELWAEIKQEFLEAIADEDNANIAKTFYNSVYGHWFSFDKVDNRYLFVEGSDDSEYKLSRRVYNSFKYRSSEEELVTRILDRYEFGVDWFHQDSDVAHITKAIKEEYLEPKGLSFKDVEIQFLKAPFFRNKGAYLIGRIISDKECVPLVLPISNLPGKGLFIEAAITNVIDTSIIFSFTRSYFMVDARIPSEYINFLHRILPNKIRAELYTSIGFIKHGKTELVRAFNQFTRRTSAQLEITKGTPGLVMTVFDLAGFDMVFKVIKDRFKAPKRTTRKQVKQCYQFVHDNDRVGRMADTQEFYNFSFPKSLVSESLLQLLLAESPSQITENGTQIVIKHCYVERKVTPLNLYLKDCNEEQRAHAMFEYGQAIKEIAQANIFPGDMLLKNFGVTRHGRVIFYDYDEIKPLLECRFRDIPKATSSSDMMSQSAWFPVAPEDVFPEEFERFLGACPKGKAFFLKHHADLFTSTYWLELQNAIKANKSFYHYPFARSHLFYPEHQARLIQGRDKDNQKSTSTA